MNGKDMILYGDQFWFPKDAIISKQMVEKINEGSMESWLNSLM